MFNRLKSKFKSKPTDSELLYYDTDSVLTKEALNRLYGLNATNNLQEVLKEKEKMNLYKVKETIICDGKRKKSTTFYSHKKYLEYINHLDDFTNHGIVHYVLKRNNFDVTVKIYM